MCKDENPKKLLGVVLGGGNCFKKVAEVVGFPGCGVFCVKDWIPSQVSLCFSIILLLPHKMTP